MIPRADGIEMQLITKMNVVVALPSPSISFCIWISVAGHVQKGIVSAGQPLSTHSMSHNEQQQCLLLTASQGTRHQRAQNSTVGSRICQDRECWESAPLSALIWEAEGLLPLLRGDSVWDVKDATPGCKTLMGHFTYSASTGRNKME